MTSIEADRAKVRVIEVSVNRRPVGLPDRRMTGLEIKEAAIAQGVPIQVDFQLSEKKGAKFHPIADTDTVAVQRGDEFRAVAGEDNS